MHPISVTMKVFIIAIYERTVENDFAFSVLATADRLTNSHPGERGGGSGGEGGGDGGSS